MKNLNTVRFMRGTYLSVIVCLLMVVSGCANKNHYVTTNKIDSATCAKLLAKGVDCTSERQYWRQAQVHTEYYQQLLPIHQRRDILDIEREAVQQE